MAITINGTGSITGLTAGGLPDGSITAADIASGVIPANAEDGAGTDFEFNSGYGSNATAYGVRAWVNFNGTSSSIGDGRANGNVSSVTDNGTGDYTVNFSTAMPDVNYSVCFGSNGGLIMNGHTNHSSDHLTTSHRFTCMGRQDSYTQGDPQVACLIYVR